MVKVKFFARLRRCHRYVVVVTIPADTVRELDVLGLNIGDLVKFWATVPNPEEQNAGKVLKTQIEMG